jgi:hypothetical protein
VIPKTSLICSLVLLVAQEGAPPKGPNGNDSHAEPTPANGPAAEYVVRGTTERTLLYLPRNETLVYEAHVDIAFLDAAVGKVTQTSIVEPYRRSVLLSSGGATDPELEAATIKIHAEGDYALYSLDSTIEARHLPQEWPRVVYRQIQQGSTNKRRENMIGMRDGEPSSSYRRDTKTGAPKGTRIWKTSRYREIPHDSLDMLSAVFACRNLVREGLDEMVFPMIEKDRLWQLTIRRGEERRIETGAGAFDAVEILLEPRPWPKEEIEAEKVEKFEGLFGMHGTIQIWAERVTGVPVRIQGDIPAGPLTLGIDVVLESYTGTPAGFAPVPE